jgi:hypothetical protein
MRRDNDTPAREYFEERAAIMEFDGGLPRHRAEFFAVVATQRYCNRRGISPPRTAYFAMVARYLQGDEEIAPSEGPPF